MSLRGQKEDEITLFSLSTEFRRHGNGNFLKCIKTDLDYIAEKTPNCDKIRTMGPTV